MNNSNLEKPIKSIKWIIITIWTHIFGIALGIVIFLSLLNALFVQLLDIEPYFNLIKIFMKLVFVGAIIYAIKLGVKAVIKNSVIKKKKIFKISLWVGLIWLFFMAGLWFLLSCFAWLSDPNIDLSIAIKLFLTNLIYAFLVSFIYFGVTYYWCKKLIK